MDINPYQSPATDFFSASFERCGERPVVDGKYLVVTSGMVLPSVCVRTNQPVGEGDLVRKSFRWCSPWVLPLILVNPLLLLLAYFILRKKCSLTFGLHPSVRQKYRRRVLFKVAAVFATFFAVLVSAVKGWDAAWFTSMVLGMSSVVALSIGNSPLKAVKYRQGMFWIKGFSPTFRARIGQMSFAESWRSVEPWVDARDDLGDGKSERGRI